MVFSEAWAFCGWGVGFLEAAAGHLGRSILSLMHRHAGRLYGWLSLDADRHSADIPSRLHGMWSLPAGGELALLFGIPSAQGSPSALPVGNPNRNLWRAARFSGDLDDRLCEIKGINSWSWVGSGRGGGMESAQS